EPHECVGVLGRSNGLRLADRLSLDRASIVADDLIRRFLSPPRLSRAFPARTTREPEFRVALPHFDFSGKPCLGSRFLDCIPKFSAPWRVALHPKVEGRLRDSCSTRRHPIECACADIGDDLLLNLVGEQGFSSPTPRLRLPAHRSIQAFIMASALSRSIGGPIYSKDATARVRLRAIVGRLPVRPPVALAGALVSFHAGFRSLPAISAGCEEDVTARKPSPAKMLAAKVWIACPMPTPWKSGSTISRCPR